MAFKDRLKSLFVYDDGNGKLPTPPAPEKLSYAEVRSGKSSLRRSVKVKNYRFEMYLKTLRTAIDSAEFEDRPDRRLLYQIYHQCLEDDQLVAQIRTAQFNVEMSPFCIERNGEVDEATEELFRKPWFFDLIRIAVDTELYGHSLMEFLFTRDKQVSKVLLIPRVHVRPEEMYGDVLLEQSDIKGIPFRSGPLAKSCLEIGDGYNLGLMKQLAKLVIRKAYANKDWDRSNESFGMPFIALKTASRDSAELDSKENFLRNFGTNNYGIFDDQDEIDLIEPISRTGGGHLTFEKLIEKLDTAIAKLINGQSGTSEEKSYVGSAEVHERQQNKYTLGRLNRIEQYINFTLFPFLLSKGYPLVDCKFRFKDLLVKDEDLDTDDTPTDQTDKSKKEKSPGKKKASA